MRVQTGAADLILAGGVESMSQTEFYSTHMRWGREGTQGSSSRTGSRAGASRPAGVNHPVPGGMLETAENLRREYSIAREEQDELSLLSHQRAVAAQQDGRFAEEIVPVPVPRGEPVVARRAPAGRRQPRGARRACGR